MAKGRCLYKLGRRRFANIEDKDDAVWIAVDNDGPKPFVTYSIYDDEAAKFHAPVWPMKMLYVEFVCFDYKQNALRCIKIVERGCDSGALLAKTERAYTKTRGRFGFPGEQMTQGDIFWLAGRERGVGLVPMAQEYGGHLLLVLGDPSKAIDQGMAFALGPIARRKLREVLDRFEETGRVTDPANWPPLGLWGGDQPPSL